MIDQHHRPAVNDTRYALRMWTVCVLLPCLGIALVGVIACATAHADQWAPAKTNCFSAADWDANLDRLPCTTVYQPDNDMVRVVQGTAITAQAECVISTSEIGDAVCHRIPTIRQSRSVNTSGSKRACNPVSHICAKVGRTAEDGSVAITVYQFNMLRPVAKCVLGNPREERGAYLAPCYPLGPATI